MATTTIRTHSNESNLPKDRLIQFVLKNKAVLTGYLENNKGDAIIIRNGRKKKINIIKSDIQELIFTES